MNDSDMYAPFDSSCEWRRERPDGKVIEREQVRGTGRTTAQLRDAPKGAMYVVLDHRFDYVINLAHKLGRSDIIFNRANNIDLLRGYTQSDIIVDHEVTLTPLQSAFLAGLKHLRVIERSRSFSPEKGAMYLDGEEQQSKFHRGVIDVYCDLIDLGPGGARLDPAKLVDRLNRPPLLDARIIAIFPDTNPIGPDQRMIIVFERG
jgi:hypothetical protein